MKKLYWICLSLGLACIVLDLIFVNLDMIAVSIIITSIMIVLVMASLIIYLCCVKFKCPKCNTIFKGNKWEVFFAAHTPTKRRLTCPMCQQKIWCENIFENLKNTKKSEVEDA